MSGSRGRLPTPHDHQAIVDHIQLAHNLLVHYHRTPMKGFRVLIRRRFHSDSGCRFSIAPVLCTVLSALS